MNNTKTIFVFFAFLVFLFHFSISPVIAVGPVPVGPTTVSETQFSYIEESGKGPSKWGEIDPVWKTCGDGKSQSPIDFLDQDVKILPNPPGDLQIAYEPIDATIKSRGHDVQVSWKGNAGKITIKGEDYNLLHCHWHIPTEHSINGGRFDLELHLLHQNSRGELAVIGALYKIGQPDPFLATLLPFIKSVTKEDKDIGIVNPKDIGLVGSQNYYRYIGSLTIPTCTEGVVWTVFQEVKMASEEQVNTLKDVVDDGFEMNARPIQALNERVVNLYKA